MGRRRVAGGCNLGTSLVWPFVLANLNGRRAVRVVHKTHSYATARCSVSLPCQSWLVMGTGRLERHFLRSVSCLQVGSVCLKTPGGRKHYGQLVQTLRMAPCSPCWILVATCVLGVACCCTAVQGAYPIVVLDWCIPYCVLIRAQHQGLLVTVCTCMQVRGTVPDNRYAFRGLMHACPSSLLLPEVSALARSWPPVSAFHVFCDVGA